MKIFVALALAALAMPAGAHEVSLDTSAARAVLGAVANANLTRAEAERIADMPQNRMVLRKVRSFDERSRKERYVAELLSAAHGEAMDETLFNFDRLKTRLPAVTATLDAIEADKEAFIQWVDDRVTSYSPERSPMELEGFIVAGGNSTGFAFGDSRFWLNVGHFRDEATAAKVVFAHELYHAVQSQVYDRAKEAGRAPIVSMTSSELASLSDDEHDAYLVNAFLTSLLNEGTAMLVGDPELLEGEQGPYSQWDLERLHTQQQRMDRLAIQLDLSLVSLTAEPRVPFEDVYALGFYGPDQPLYYLGYAMAKAIEAEEGRPAIGELISSDGCGFVETYLQTTDGQEKYPKLGDATLRLVGRHCD